MSIECTTDYHYGMSVKYKATGIGRLAVRIPKWNRKNLIRINGSDISPTLESDYQYIDVNGMTEVELILDGNPRFVRASGKIPRLTGMAALMRGPLVYCFEGADNGSVRELRIKRSVAPEVHEFEPQLLGGYVKLIASAYRVRDQQLDEVKYRFMEVSIFDQMGDEKFAAWTQEAKVDLKSWGRYC